MQGYHEKVAEAEHNKMIHAQATRAKVRGTDILLKKRL